MSWFATALGITSTIGKIAGGIAGALGVNAVVFDIRSDSSDMESDAGQIAFKLNGAGKIMAMNTSTSNNCQIFFPGNSAGESPALTGLSVMLSPVSQLDVTQPFNDYSNGDVDTVLITPSGTVSGPNADGGGGGTVQAAATNIPPNTQIKIDSYFNVMANVSQNNVTVGLVGGLVLTGMVLLNVRGAGNTVCKIINAVKKTQVDGLDDNSMTFAMPAGVDISNGLVSIDMIASTTLQSLNQAVVEFAKNNNVIPITPEELAAIKHA